MLERKLRVVLRGEVRRLGRRTEACAARVKSGGSRIGDWRS